MKALGMDFKPERSFANSKVATFADPGELGVALGEGMVHGNVPWGMNSLLNHVKHTASQDAFFRGRGLFPLPVDLEPWRKDGRCSFPSRGTGVARTDLPCTQCVGRGQKESTACGLWFLVSWKPLSLESLGFCPFLSLRLFPPLMFGMMFWLKEFLTMVRSLLTRSP